MVSNSEFLTEEENKVLMGLAHLCSSVSRNDISDPRKKHIKETVDRLSHLLLSKNLDPNL